MDRKRKWKKENKLFKNIDTCERIPKSLYKSMNILSNYFKTKQVLEIFYIDSIPTTTSLR